MNNSEEILREQKWKKLLSYRRFFAYIPFLDFVLVAGSLVFGKVHENSDFDVIIGTKPGRIFTVRFFCFLVFGFLGIRRNHQASKESGRDKVCFNHFVTPASYALQPPYNIYWQKLYQNLKAIYGNADEVKLFFEKNKGWSEREEFFFNKDLWQREKFNLFRQCLEIILNGAIGDFFESFVKKLQVRKIEKSLKKDIGFNPRLRYDDEELEFHPDTSRIEDFLKTSLKIK